MDTETHCHCGAQRGSSDHCECCGCEEFETVCDWTCSDAASEDHTVTCWEG